jgi:lipopolysaccharide transport system permease protein
VPPVITRAPHLVKKIVFPVEVLPIVSMVSAALIHAGLLLVVMAVLALQGALSWSTLWQLPLWFGLLSLTVTAIASMAATLNVVWRDTSAMIPFLVSAAFWLTPIVWTADKLPPAWRDLALANPFAICVEGYRAALLGQSPPFSSVSLLVSAAVLVALAALALYLFRLFRPEFADHL